MEMDVRMEARLEVGMWVGSGCMWEWEWRVREGDSDVRGRSH